MTSLAVISFDLKGPPYGNYQKMKETLAEYGFHPYLQADNGKYVKLPTTVYGRASNDVPERKWVKDVLLWAAKVAGAKLGNYFILVCTQNCSWLAGSGA